jgi:hypothetical protein
MGSRAEFGRGLRDDRFAGGFSKLLPAREAAANDQVFAQSSEPGTG